MTETWNAASLAGIDYYGRDLDIGKSGRKRLLWPEFGQLWAQNLFELFFLFSFFFFLFLFFNKRELGVWYLLVEETMAMRHIILTKRLM
jgi:hypothetical protein